MNLEVLSSLIIQEYVEDKIKKLIRELDIEEDLVKDLEGEIRDICMYIVDKVNNNISLEAFNEDRIEELYKEAFKDSIGRILNKIPKTVSTNNLLIKKFRESLDNGDNKAFLYYLLIKKLLSKESHKETPSNEDLLTTKSDYEVVIH